MNKKNIFRITILFFIITLVILSNISVMATSLGLGELDNYAQSQGTSTQFEDKVGAVLGVFQVAGSALSVICLIILGVKYMMGSVEEKAEYKKTLIPYAIGAIMVLGISNVVNIIYKIATGIQ